MALQWTIVLVLLAPCAEATMLNNPSFCYILDGFLLLYCIIITAFFIKAKYTRDHSKSQDNSTYSELITSGEQYDWLNRDIESGNRPRVQRTTEEVYTPLKPGAGDTYREIPVKKERRRHKNDMVYEGLSAATKDTQYDSLQLYPVGQRR